MAKILVLSVDKKNGISQKGNAYEMCNVGGFVSLDDGTKKPGQIVLFSSPSNPLPDIQINTEYQIDVSVSVNYRMEVEARIKGLVKKA